MGQLIDHGQTPFTRKNYQLMVIGLLTVIAGFTFMALDTQPYGFWFHGDNPCPIVVVAGFVIGIWPSFTPKGKE